MRFRGQDYESAPVTVEVVPDASAPQTSPHRDPTAANGVGAPGFRPPKPSHAQDVFLHVVTDRDAVFVGEQVIVTWLLYTRTELLQFEPSPPRLTGFWSETLFEPTSYFRYSQDRVGGTTYDVTVVSKRAVFPTRVGQIHVEPYRAKVTNLFTALGDPLEIESPRAPLTVRPLPDGAPPGFDPTYVGSFSIRAEVDRDEIDAGESMTLTVTIQGHGAIRRTTPPQLKADGFEFREPRDYEERVDTTDDRIAGERVYRYWTTPRRGGAQTIPAIELPYFNPRAERYVVARTDPIPIVVRGDPTPGARDTGAPISRDIRLMREGAAIASRVSPALYRTPWYWLLAALPGLAFVGVLVWDRLRTRRRRDTPRARSRRIQRRFRAAARHRDAGHAGPLFAELAQIIDETVRDRLATSDPYTRGHAGSRQTADHPGSLPSGQSNIRTDIRADIRVTTRRELSTALAERGFAAPLIQRIEAELERCDFVRFAPSDAANQDLNGALERARALVRDILAATPHTAAEDA
jgi:hypothetical protein